MTGTLELIGIGKVLLASLLGGVMGIERERAGKAAGLRTHMFIAGGSALFVQLGEIMSAYYAGQAGIERMVADPTRVIQAIVVGISFIGAGTIIQNSKEERVKNLTTAASILFTSGIGIAVGASAYLFAAGITLLGLVISSGVRLVELQGGLSPRKSDGTYSGEAGHED